MRGFQDGMLRWPGTPTAGIPEALLCISPGSWLHWVPASPNELLIGSKLSWLSVGRAGEVFAGWETFLNLSSRLAKTVTNSIMNHNNDTAETHKMQDDQCWAQKVSDPLGKPHSWEIPRQWTLFPLQLQHQRVCSACYIALHHFLPFSFCPKNRTPALPQEIVLRIYLCN